MNNYLTVNWREIVDAFKIQIGKCDQDTEGVDAIIISGGTAVPSEPNNI